jgi:nicotinamide-nucleotide amidase
LRATLINIGDEILIGQIINTNSVYLAKSLIETGIMINEIICVSDTSDAIIKSINSTKKNNDIIVFTGGLGPTKDDLTKLTLSEYFNDELILYPDILKHIEEMFKNDFSSTINRKNRDQALLPKKAKIFKNMFGTASGMLFEKDKTLFFSLPGVPHEMKMLMENSIIPELKNRFSLPFIYHKTLLTYGLGESIIAQRIEFWENELPKEIKLAYLPGLGRVRLRLSSKGNNKNKVIELVESSIAKLIPLIEDIYYGTEDSEPLEKLIAKKLTDLGKSLSLAESCTGGRLSSKFINFPGASKFFHGSSVVYSTKSKTDILGISEELIKTNGVVSAEVAKAMALSVKNIYKTDYSIAITGNAGPSLGDPSELQGSVYIALANSMEVKSYNFQLGNHREQVIEKSLNKALELLYKEITLININ